MALVPPSPESKTPNNIFFRLLEDLWLPAVLLAATAALGWWVNARFTFSGPLGLALHYLIRFGPIWLPLLLFYIWWQTWLYYLRSRFPHSPPFSAMALAGWLAATRGR